MKYRFFLIAGAVIVAIVLIVVLTQDPKIKALDIKDIASMELYITPSEESSSMDDDTMEIFIAAYNAASAYRNDHGTTHGHMVKINFNDGTFMYVAGGTQGFQTVMRDGEQYNIQGDRLWDFFKSLDE